MENDLPLRFINVAGHDCKTVSSSKRVLPCDLELPRMAKMSFNQLLYKRHNV